MDPSALHSYGWEIQEKENDDDPRTKPDHSQPPPTLEECQTFKPAIQRIIKFYVEGVEKQAYHVEQIKKEKQYFLEAENRIKAQLEDLKKYPESHPRRKVLEKELNEESKFVQRNIRARDSAENKLKMLDKKRNEIVETMSYLGNLLEDHCKKLQNNK